MNATPSLAPRHVAIREASTDDVGPHERVAYWEAYTADALIGVRCSAYAEEGLRARQRNFDLGALQLAEISANEHVVERTTQVMRRHPKDSLFACMLVEGEAFFYQSGRCIPVRQGDLIVYGTTMPYLYGVNRAARHVQVDLPLEALLERRALPRFIEPLHLDAGLSSGRRLTQALRTEMLQFIAAPLADRAHEVARTVQSLLEGLLRAHTEERGCDADLRLLKAERYIAEHLCDPLLDAARVADHVAVSPRHLNRLFEVHGCTATQWIWRERLAHGHRLLADRATARLSVGDVALQCGFATQAHFARAFREHYGCTPTEHRSGANGQTMPVPRTGAGPV